jgi:hypothetical protein
LRLGADSRGGTPPAKKPTAGRRSPWQDYEVGLARARITSRRRSARSEICALLRGCAPTVYHCGMFIISHGAPEGYEWFVTLLVLVGLYFAVRNFMRARR